MTRATFALLLAACDMPRPEAPPIEIPPAVESNRRCDAQERHGYPYQMVAVRLSGNCPDVPDSVVDARIGGPVDNSAQCDEQFYSSPGGCHEALTSVCDERLGPAIRSWSVEWFTDGTYGVGYYRYAGVDCTSTYRITLERI